MDASETGRLVGELAVLRNECETLAEVTASVGEMDRYPSEAVQLLTEAAKEAKDLKYRILNALIGAGPEVDSWRKLIDEMEFIESYRVDKDFRWEKGRPNARNLNTAALILANVCRHLGSEPETQNKKKASGRRGHRLTSSGTNKWPLSLGKIA